MNFYRPTWVEIDLNAFIHNFLVIKKKLHPVRNSVELTEETKSSGKEIKGSDISNGVKILAVVKADAYGHGAIPLVRKFLQYGGDYLGVSSIEEGIILRRAGIPIPILILGSIYPYETFPQIFEYNLTPTVASLPVIEELNRLAKNYQSVSGRLPVHLKIDTGMGRIGISPSLVSGLVKKIFNSNLILEGIYSHLASAALDLEYTSLQIDILKKIKDELDKEGVIVPYYHIANSAAFLRHPESWEYFNLVRLGLLLYGLLPYKDARKDIEVKPVLSLKTKIVFLKKVPAGRKISYGGTFVTKRESWIATLPIGYADGYSRFLSNPCPSSPGDFGRRGGEVLVKGNRVPVIGRVTMDMIMVDLTDLISAGIPIEVGEEVVLIGEQGRGRITVEELAEKIGTISYEIVCGLSKRLPRVYRE
ncbi:MAG TPA: alanine racemase [Elusimicrobia bacterium]|jgi:alanine racemase|nr:alanine racemase [Elusimicrobiota bacterium]